MKIKILRIVLILMLIGTFYTIFGFSSQNAEVSGGMSKKITQAVVKKFPNINKKEQTEKEKIEKRTESVIRKIAHFSIYTLVGLFLMALMSTYDFKEINRIAISLIIGLIYASSDEIHQSFVPGRSAQITDVLLDFMGVSLGMLMIKLIVEIFRKFGKNLNVKK